MQAYKNVVVGLLTTVSNAEAALSSELKKQIGQELLN